jgi:hypothetical protein
LHDWFIGQAVVAETSKQPSESAAHVETWPESGQNVPLAVQPAGGVLQTHEFEPEVPLHVWRGPQTCVLDTTTQPCASGAQVAVSVPLKQ